MKAKIVGMLTDSQRYTLISVAKILYTIYQSPVYLCGSALRKSQPRDWDIRIKMSAFNFHMRFGDAKQWELEGQTGKWRHVRSAWSDECSVMSMIASFHLQLLVDIQIYPPRFWREFAKCRKLRLDLLEQ